MATKALPAKTWTSVPVPKAGTATFTNPATTPVYVKVSTTGDTVKVQPTSSNTATILATTSLTAVCSLAVTLTMTVA